MNASIAQPRRSLPGWFNTVVWLAAFLSPTAYSLLLVFVSELQVPRLPETFVAALFFLIPVVALFICEWVVWSRSKTVGRRIGWMVLTLVGMLLQVGVILVILRAIILTRIAYVQ